MKTAFGAARSAFSLALLIVLYIAVGTPILYLYVLPWTWRRPQERTLAATWYMRLMSRLILAVFRLGGAGFAWSGSLPTESPVLILMNHQSLLDIPVVTQLSSGVVPAFVTRSRYARFIPLISPSIRLLGCPIVRPGRDPLGSVTAINDAVCNRHRPLLIFPEGHRTRDGAIRPFRTGGILTVLKARRLPLYLVVTDGYWVGRRFVDFLFNLHRIQGRTEVLGPFLPPERDQDLPAFVTRLRGLMVEHLDKMRKNHAA